MVEYPSYLIPDRHAERPQSGLLFQGSLLAPEPLVKRTVAFVDGQNLFYAAREAFGYRYPNYDVKALAGALCRRRGWHLGQVRFYTGIPDRRDPTWRRFWMHKLAAMGRQGVHVFSRPLRYRTRTIRLPNGTTHDFVAAEEKGIDVRLALDAVRLAHRREYDVAIVMSQDQDLSEVADEVRTIARQRLSVQSLSSVPARHR